MKKYITSGILFFSIVALCGCHIITTGKNGNGHVIKQARSIGAFNKLKIDGVFKVFINQGDTENVVVEADDNLIGLIESNVANNELELNIKKDSSIGKSTKLNIYVTIKDLQQMNIVGVNGVSSNALNVNHLQLNIDGVGSTDLNIHCKTIHANLSGVGNLKLIGEADSATIENSGVGSLYAAKFITQKLHITNSGVGNAEVNAEQEISINNSGVGNVKHNGKAIVSKIKNDGVGKVVKE
jgi:hypothetical protein